MAETTTIRVSAATRDRLNALAARRGEPAGEVVAKLVEAADDDLLLASAEASFRQIAKDPAKLAAYRAEADDLAGFDAPAPDW
jgi:predicted DNA-binding protein